MSKHATRTCCSNIVWGMWWMAPGRAAAAAALSTQPERRPDHTQAPVRARTLPGQAAGGRPHRLCSSGVSSSGSVFGMPSLRRRRSITGANARAPSRPGGHRRPYSALSLCRPLRRRPCQAVPHRACMCEPKHPPAPSACGLANTGPPTPAPVGLLLACQPAAATTTAAHLPPSRWTPGATPGNMMPPLALGGLFWLWEHAAVRAGSGCRSRAEAARQRGPHRACVLSLPRELGMGSGRRLAAARLRGLVEH